MEPHEPEHGVQRVSIELSNRHLLILIHGLLLFEVGIVMMLTGAPDFFAEWFGPWARIYMGLGAAIPGLILIAGAVFSDTCRKGFYLQALGLAGVVGWHAAMAIFYFSYAIDQGVPLLGAEEPSPPGSARLYVPLIYGNILLLGLAHLVTLLRLGRPPR